jgi:hypothetical protein
VRIDLDMGNAADAGFVEALVEAVRKAGLLVAAEPRTRPFLVSEAAVETGLSETQVRRLVGSGRLKRIEGTGRMLILADSVRNFNTGKRS